MEQNKSWFSKVRIETFSDAVFAIIMTILVLEIKVPVIKNPNSFEDLGLALIVLLPKLISWVISFFMLCVVWLNHHRIFESITHVTYKLFWYNAYLLIWCAFIPFPTALVGDYPQNKMALLIFGLVMGLMGLGFVFIRQTILKDRLLIEKLNAEQFKKDNFKSLFFGCILYLLGSLSALIHPIISYVIFGFIPFYFIVLNIKSGKELTRKE